jgi:hypothetical protein
MINSWLAAIERSVRLQHSLGVASRPLLLIIILGLSLSFGARQARAQCGSLGAPSTMWQNGGNSFWDLSGNWTSGTPTASTNACILNGTSTVTLNTAGSANGLQLASGNTLDMNGGASLSLGSGTSLIEGMLSNTAGTITNSGTLKNGATVFVDGAVVSGSLVGVLINNSGAHLTNNGTIELFSAGLINNSGAHLTNNGTIEVDSDNARLMNSGTFINNSVLSLNTHVVFDNAAGASVVNFGTITEEAGVLSNEGAFNNRGTINLTTMGDPSTFSNSGTFNNRGSLTMNSSPLNGPSSFSNSGTLNNRGTVALDDSCQPGCSFSNSGTFNNSGAFNITHSAIGATGEGLFTNSGTFNNSGGTLSNGLTSTLDNTGTINNTSGGHINNLSTITNEGIFNNTSGAHLMDAGTFDNTGIFSNSGTVRISSTGLFTTSTDYTQTAGRTIVNGTLSATGGAIVDIEGGKLGGTGMINGDVLMKGTMSPGSGGAPGTLTVNGSYEQNSGSVFDEIIKGASSNGLLDVTGALALDPGSLLAITLQAGFDPVGDSFTILDYGSLSGEFLNGSSFVADGFNWTLTYGPNDAILTAVSADPVNTPEPGTLALIAFGFLPLFGYAATRRTVGRDSIDLRQSPRI